MVKKAIEKSLNHHAGKRKTRFHAAPMQAYRFAGRTGSGTPLRASSAMAALIRSGISSSSSCPVIKRNVE
jgi:hypothetical protein